MEIISFCVSEATMTGEFMKFNVFGLIRADRNHVHIMATAARHGKAVDRSLSEDWSQPLEELSPGEISIIMFAADIDDHGKAQVATQSISEKAGGKPIVNNKQLSAALHKIIKQFAAA